MLLLVAGSTRADGPVVGWGYDGSEQATPPAAVDGTDGIASAITGGANHSCAIQAGSGAVVCWGSNRDGQATPAPSVDGTLGTASAISAGDSHTLAIATVPESAASLLAVAGVGTLVALARYRGRLASGRVR